MSSTMTQTRGRELNGLLRHIRERWSDEERQRRQRIAEEKQRWLLSIMQQSDVRQAS